MKNHRLIYIAIAFLFIVAFPAGAQDIPTGRAISLEDLLDLTKSLGGFLFVLGGIVAGITIIISGIMYFMSGGNQQKVNTAKNILLAGIIGTFIIFGSGMIVRTIQGFSTDPLMFFR